MSKEYNPFKLTAITRKNMSVPYRHESKLFNKSDIILDYGCGHGEDADILNKEGYNIIKYDKFNEVYQHQALLKIKYDKVVCNYVLNTIPNMETHNEVVKTLRNLSDSVYVAVRADKKAIKDKWTYDDANMCYKTSKGSYQRFYDEDIIDKLFGKVEYIVNNSVLKLFKLL